MDFKLEPGDILVKTVEQRRQEGTVRDVDKGKGNAEEGEKEEGEEKGERRGDQEDGGDDDDAIEKRNEKGGEKIGQRLFWIETGEEVKF